jgi:hypothetical protein
MENANNNNPFLSGVSGIPATLRPVLKDLTNIIPSNSNVTKKTTTSHCVIHAANKSYSAQSSVITSNDIRQNNSSLDHLNTSQNSINNPLNNSRSSDNDLLNTSRSSDSDFLNISQNSIGNDTSVISREEMASCVTAFANDQIISMNNEKVLQQIEEITDALPGGTDICIETKVKFVNYFQKVKILLAAGQDALDQLQGINVTGISRYIYCIPRSFLLSN